jgi:hypothetical protein
LSKEWIEIGFQGADPATDFRGAGILGLQQLLTVCTEEKYREESLKMYADSLTPECWYFFAVTGINITNRLIISLKSCGGLGSADTRTLSSSGSSISSWTGAAATNSKA